MTVKPPGSGTLIEDTSHLWWSEPPDLSVPSASNRYAAAKEIKSGL